MKKITKIIALVLAVAMLSAFTDVPKKHWAYNEVATAQSLGLIHGMTEKIFAPDDTITKEQMAFMLYNISLATEDVNDSFVNECISQSAIALKQAKVAEWSYTGIAPGLVNGYWKLEDFEAPFNGKSGGSSALARQMLSRWVVKIIGLREFGLKVLPYTDNDDIDLSYYSYVDSLYKYGVMIGSDGAFLANGVLTRAQAATVAVRLYKEKTEKYTGIDKNPFVYESGKASDFSDKYKTFKLGEKLIQIDESAKLLIDGKLSTFADLAKLSGKNIVLSEYVAGSNYKNVVVQTKPTICSGTVEEYVKTSIPEKSNSSYSYVAINIGGSTFDYVINSNTDILGSLGVGSSVQFIADGIYLQEIK